jgi:3-oxoadipate enol-lactonase
VSAVAVHRVVQGPEEAPVLVLSPSLGSTLEMWAPQAAALRERFRVVRYDHRGHGGSPVPGGPYSLADLGGDLLCLLDDLGAERAHLCGLSLGGMVAMWVAQHAPERVGRLVLCCTSAAFGPPSLWAERARTVRAQGTAAVAASVVERWLTPAWREQRPAEVARLEAMVAATPPEGYASACSAIETMAIEGRLGAIAAPTLVISGAQDPATPPEHGRAIADGIPGARLVVLDPGAHLASWERADAVSALIREHLEAAA